ncbi:hypothetical protein C8T65DRAFT_689242 [Cerioporus squamosus]|nr:hypothetical protein C8T65DRAFT_689242 [Cerioporus squamosus]
MAGEDGQAQREDARAGKSYRNVPLSPIMSPPPLRTAHARAHFRLAVRLLRYPTRSTQPSRGRWPTARIDKYMQLGQQTPGTQRPSGTRNHSVRPLLPSVSLQSDHTVSSDNTRTSALQARDLHLEKRQLEHYTETSASATERGRRECVPGELDRDMFSYTKTSEVQSSCARQYLPLATDEQRATTSGTAYVRSLGSY